MNKLLLICSLLLVTNGTTQTDEPEPYSSNRNLAAVFVKTNTLELPISENVNTFDATVSLDYDMCEIIDCSKKEDLAINDIVYIEDEVELTFDFNVEEYLPRGFNPYETYFNINDVEFIEEEVELEFNYDVQSYLPKNFNPYASPAELDLKTVIFIEEETSVELGFDVNKYLPEGFDAYAKPAVI